MLDVLLASDDPRTSWFLQNSDQWKKDTWTKTIHNTSRRGEVESLMEERLQFEVNKWWKGLFKRYCEDMEEDQIQSEQNWRSVASDKWDVIGSHLENGYRSRCGTGW
jgi:hypothetical protein